MSTEIKKDGEIKVEQTLEEENANLKLEKEKFLEDINRTQALIQEYEAEIKRYKADYKQIDEIKTSIIASAQQQLERIIKENKDEQAKKFEIFSTDLEHQFISSRQKIFLDIVELYDNLCFVYESIEDKEKSLGKAIKDFINRFSSILKKNNIEEIACSIGDKANYDFHHAVYTEKTTGEQGIVTKILKKGYKYKDYIIRYTFVVVSE